ncbi:MAG: UDP-glycosyltransferase [Lutibacter sp.]|uniref:UDP-glycosyltransferase n=1 Tax=Lutibacter sp. TaxID=1925666 RepID=UPI00299EC59D|nr:UDP-glycosyltransferase [Lutibacter sp.]MDX1828179.1 UDP-glycosyltransferase [Lutibacter sp.]
MNRNKKIFIFLPDGVGLRNFTFTNFPEIGNGKDYDIIYWNNTVFPIEQMFKYNEKKVDYLKPNPLTDVFKRSRTKIELKQNYRQFKDSAYLTYIFPQSYKTLKSAIKSAFVSFLAVLFNYNKDLIFIRKVIKKLERRSRYYKRVKLQLQKEKPNFIFCTNQRPLSGISPLLAAKDLFIPTGTFIFSWDNLPKGTLVVETDYYFVWSDYMKMELLQYYPFINEDKIKVVGTPQFEMHFDKKLIQSRKVFFKENGLETERRYICFSGDDITTSPYDQFYLRDIANSVRKLNISGYNLGVIFRRCPVDFSDRFDNILEEFSDVIVSINPDWKKYGNAWNTVMPTPNDLKVLVNTIKYTEVVINIGSSMVFDYACHNKPCIYINYNTDEVDINKWNINTIYKYIHFKSMPNKECVVWLNDKDEIELKLKNILNNSSKTVVNAKNWFKIINIEDPKLASENIWNEISKIIS